MKCLFVGIMFFACSYMICSRDLVSARILAFVDDSNVEISNCPKGISRHQSPVNENRTICDCKPRRIYFPLNNSCYEAYTRGPCSKNHYVVLSENTRGSFGPSCVPNPCLEDGTVMYNSTCYPLRTIDGPCAPDGVLDVNETTFELECVSIKVTPSILLNSPRRRIPSGKYRSMLGISKNQGLNAVHQNSSR